MSPVCIPCPPAPSPTPSSLSTPPNGAPSMTLHAFHPWCDKQTQRQRQGSCDVVCKLFAKLPSLVPVVPVVLQELVECVPGFVTFCDTVPLGPTLMSHVDKRHITSLNDVIFCQMGVVRFMSQMSIRRKRQHHATFPTKLYRMSAKFILPPKMTDLSLNIPR